MFPLITEYYYVVRPQNPACNQVHIHERKNGVILT